MITYNHEPYIAQAIEGVLMQETDFPYELVIGEDCSTDNTRKICEEYAKRFPDKIRLLAGQRNFGIVPNFRRTFNACQGEFVALCEGDDYWISPLKIQRQKEFLDNNSKYSGTCSDVMVLDMNTGSLQREQVCAELADSHDLCFDELLHRLIIYTPTLMLRRELIDLNLYKDHFLFCDLINHLLLLDKGPIRFERIDEVVYRLHRGGITSRAKYREFYQHIIEFLADFDAYTKYRHTNSIRDRTQYLNALVRITDEDRNLVDRLIGVYPYFRYPYVSVSRSEIGNVLGLISPKFVSALRKRLR